MGNLTDSLSSNKINKEALNELCSVKRNFRLCLVFPPTLFRCSIRFLPASITTEHRAQSRLIHLVIKKQLVIYYLFLLEQKTEGSCNYFE